MRSRLGLGLTLLALASASARAAQPVYNLFPTAVTGSARDVGLSGAGLALPLDYSACFANPAGLGGLSGTGIDFGSDSNSIDNFVVDLDNPGLRTLNDPIRYSFYGFRYVSEDGWGWGLAKQTPYQIDNLFIGDARVGRKRTCFKDGKAFECGNLQTGLDETELKVVDNTYTLAAAKSFLDRRLALGLSVNYIQVTETYDFRPVFTSTPSVHLDATSEAVTADAGAIARPRRWLQAALVYRMGYRVPFDPSRNRDAFGTTGTAKPFRDSKVPDRVTLALAWLPHPRFRLFAQSTYVVKMDNGIIVAAGALPGSVSVVEAGRRYTIDGHWGAEYIPIDEPDLTFKMWAGGYYEDTGIQGGYTRYHRTAGFGLSPWFLTLSMAIDDADLYNNFVVGLGVDLLQVSQRVAKKYGWKLPL